MLQTITIHSEDILHQVKLLCQTPELIEKIVTLKILEDAAAQVNIKVDTKELQEAADKFRLNQQLHSAQDTWEWLQKYNLSLDDFEEKIYVNIICEKLVDHLFRDKVEPYFFEHQLDYAGVAMFEVVLDDLDLAMELFYSIREGEMSFHDIAHQYIQNSELRRSGGYKGIVRRNSLKPEICAAVFAAQPPQLLKPIVTSEGVHLILVEEIIKPQLNEELHYQIMSDLFDEWLNQEIAHVEVVQKLDLNLK